MTTPPYIGPQVPQQLDNVDFLGRGRMSIDIKCISK